mmetsp:Transcript_8418/g.19901  ORF Transcript_8418/g.19901 Transcript_8418/m.19901 type:complete len:278 (+) Transcript_8418:471-1304(+)
MLGNRSRNVSTETCGTDSLCRHFRNNSTTMTRNLQTVAAWSTVASPGSSSKIALKAVAAEREARVPSTAPSTRRARSLAAARAPRPRCRARLATSRGVHEGIARRFERRSASSPPSTSVCAPSASAGACMAAAACSMEASGVAMLSSSWPPLPPPASPSLPRPEGEVADHELEVDEQDGEMLGQSSASSTLPSLSSALFLARRLRVLSARRQRGPKRGRRLRSLPASQTSACRRPTLEMLTPRPPRSPSTNRPAYLSAPRKARQPRPWRRSRRHSPS